MHENHCILVNSTKLLLICESKSEFFPANVSKPTRILYVRCVVWSTVEADVTYINNLLKNYRIFFLWKTISRAVSSVSYLTHFLLHYF